MGTPQIIWILIMALSLGNILGKHGQPETGKHSFWVTSFAVGLQAAILYWGGFFG